MIRFFYIKNEFKIKITNEMLSYNCRLFFYSFNNLIWHLRGFKFLCLMMMVWCSIFCRDKRVDFKTSASASHHARNTWPGLNTNFTVSKCETERERESTVYLQLYYQSTLWEVFWFWKKFLQLNHLIVYLIY